MGMVGEEKSPEATLCLQLLGGLWRSCSRQRTANRITQGLCVPAQSQQPPYAKGFAFLGLTFLVSNMGIIADVGGGDKTVKKP